MNFGFKFSDFGVNFNKKCVNFYKKSVDKIGVNFNKKGVNFFRFFIFISLFCGLVFVNLRANLSENSANLNENSQNSSTLQNGTQISQTFVPQNDTNSQTNPLQTAINSAQNGDIITLSGGVYEGNIIINKPLIIKGESHKALIKGDGKGDVIIIKSSNVKIENLSIQNSGDSHSDLHSAIKCENANDIEIINNNISNALFGINFSQCNNAKITHNKIRSKPVDLGLRGDALRLWYSHNNLIFKNHIDKSRDMVIWYSSNNIIKENLGENSRYSLHFMYAGKNLVQNNTFRGNSVGIFFMFSQGSLVENNVISHSSGAFGVGIGMKDTSDFIIKNNTLSHNARGFYIDQSPFQPGSVNVYENNQILYNVTGLHFHATLHKSIFENNDFIGNLEVALNDTPESAMSLNEFRGNFFDDYEGFDLDKDGFGDLEFRHYAYLDTLWHYYPNLRFFYGTPLLAGLNFLAKLAPFSSPQLIIKDSKPKMKPNNVI